MLVEWRWNVGGVTVECWRKDGGVERWMSSAWCGMMAMERNERV